VRLLGQDAPAHLDSHRSFDAISVRGAWLQLQNVDNRHPAHPAGVIRVAQLGAKLARVRYAAGRGQRQYIELSTYRQFFDQ
jgi:hypothetical protein